MTGGWFSQTGLARLHDVMAGHVERGDMPGCIALVARDGRTHLDVIGTRTFGDAEPLQRNDVFRITSMTKPITAAAVMTLVEAGSLHLDAPVDDLLPELANRRVLRSIDADLDDTVPAKRPITLEDLLTFRLGLGMVFAQTTYPILEAEKELQLATVNPPYPPSPHSTDEWLRRLGTLPLINQPGEQWMYNTGAQVLGAVLERATGKSLEAVLHERILGPLGMGDTAFTVSPAMKGRLTTAYEVDRHTGELAVVDGVEGGYWSRSLAFPSASAWLLSTIDNFWTFVRMLLNRGAHDGGRILSEKSVERMTTDHLAQSQRAFASPFLGDTEGWGYCMAAPASGAGPGTIPRGFGWNGGGAGTSWRSDVDADLTGILFTQRAMGSAQSAEVYADFWKAAYAAIDS
jgi:CubicO group peptidase (beta-lactamase class C family)